MPRINGSIVGKSNRPTYLQAGGAWLSSDIENARRIGAWPLALSTTVVAIAHSSSPYITVYPWSIDGFGTKYSDPTTVPPTTTRGVNFSPGGDSVAVAYDNGIQIAAYAWSSNGFGTKYSDPSTPPSISTSSDGFDIEFSPDGDSLAIGHSGSPFLSIYPWSSSGGFGTKYNNPATLPPNTANGVTFSPTGDVVAAACELTPFIVAYPWSSSSGFGSRYNNPSTLPPAAGGKVKISSNNTIIVAHNNSPLMTAYPWSSVTGFGTKYNNASSLPTASGASVAFSPSGDTVGCGPTASTNRLPLLYPWDPSTGFGTKYSDPVNFPATLDINDLEFTPTGNAIVFAINSTPFTVAYPWTSSGFGTRYSNPSTLPAGIGRGVAFTVISV